MVMVRNTNWKADSDSYRAALPDTWEVDYGLDTKVIDRITDHERGQMLNYLRITGLHVGLILNFQKPKLEWEHVVL